MSVIPVMVQRPNEPHSARLVGEAAADMTAAAVAKLVGVPDGCLLEGKVIRRRGTAMWSLVAEVRFVEQTAMRPASKIAELEAATAELLDALTALTDWMREHTSPHDANSPHDLLVKAVTAIGKAGGRRS